jgi:hypothetical protein
LTLIHFTLASGPVGNETPAADIARLPIRRNVALISAAVAANASMLQLTAAVASISLARALDVEGLLGLGPAIVLAAGFALGAASCGLAGAAFELVALALVAGVRPDPKAIASLLGHESPPAIRPAAPLGDLLRRSGVVPALVAAQMSVGVMVGVMTLTGNIPPGEWWWRRHDEYGDG